LQHGPGHACRFVRQCNRSDIRVSSLCDVGCPATLLLAHGADVNAHNEDDIGETPLGLVAASCSYEMAKILIDGGADPRIPGWMGNTALTRASERKRPEGRLVHELLEHASRKLEGSNDR
jgi:ankyrin repeat protein